MTISLKILHPPIHQTAKLNSSVQTQIKPKFEFQFVPRDTEESAFLDSVVKQNYSYNKTIHKWSNHPFKLVARDREKAHIEKHIPGVTGEGGDDEEAGVEETGVYVRMCQRFLTPQFSSFRGCSNLSGNCPKLSRSFCNIFREYTSACVCARARACVRVFIKEQPRA